MKTERAQKVPHTSLASYSSLALSFLFGILALCLFPTKSIGQALTIDRFSTEEGLSEGYVYTVSEDANGFLWLGIGAGIYRFDGLKFKLYTTRDSLTQDFTTASYLDDRGRLWFGHFGGGLSLLQGDKFSKVLSDKALGSPIVSIGQSPDGMLWAASQQNGLLKIDPESLETSQVPIDLEDIAIFSAHIDGSTLMLGTDDGLYLFGIANGIATLKGQVVETAGREIQTIAPRTKGGFWLGTKDDGLFEYQPASKTTTHFGSDQLKGIGNISSILEESPSKIWIGTFGHGFSIFNDSDPERRMVPVQNVNAQDSSQIDIIKVIYKDRFDQVWMGTYGNGMLRIVESEMAIYGVKADTFARGITALFQDSQQHVWIGSQNGLFFLENERTIDFGNQYGTQGNIILKASRRMTTADGLPSNEITSIAEDEKGGLWIGTHRNGIARKAPGADRFEIIPLSSLPLSNMINAIQPMGAGKTWIATQDGAFYHDLERNEAIYFSTRNGLPHNSIYDIFPDTKGRIWFATKTNRVSVYDGESFVPITVTDTGEVTSVNCIAESPDGAIWFGTDGSGMYRFEKDRFDKVGEAQGLSSNYCYQIAVDQLGIIWGAHRKGFSRYIPETETSLIYPNATYLGFEDNTISCTLLDQSGNLWFGSNYGLIHHPWQKARAQIEAPRIMISSIEIGGEAYPLDNGLRLPYGSYQARLTFLGLTFLRQEEVVYQYKLEGRDEDWSEITDITHANFQGLVDGDYTFKVRARNVYGKWNEKPATFEFSISPPFWKAMWFRILVVLAIAGLIFGYVKYRVYRLNKEKEALEQKVEQRTIELKEQKDKLEDANLELEKLSLVASETDNAVFIIDKEGQLEWVNPGFTRLTGYTLDEIRAMQHGKNFLTLSSNSEIGQLIDEVVKNNTSIQYESRLPSKHGETIWVISTLTPILDESGQLRKIVIIDSNISDRKEAEEEVRKINEKLEQLVEERTAELAEANHQLQLENVEHIKTAEQLKATNQELDSFVYRASHDLKGPLASLLGLVSIAKAELTDNEVATRYLDLMERRGERLDTILVDLIEATQVKQAKVELATIQPSELLHEVLEHIKYKSGMSEVDFRVQVDEELEIVTDRKLLRAILNNYIENAAKYRDPQKEKAISETKISLKDGQIHISVKDNGVGIPESAQNSVFDMFFRGTNTVSGSGLGLYIVKQAVDKLGGTVGMDSTEGKGTTFFAVLPNHSSEA